ncbi:hypothetical protein [Oscillibacter sp.]|uniref:hypothetical protein n=1 Tax=Oscillibacter sp. TaxID=1945593 RepID=UPI002D7EBCCE|nr:hypothetical protein [Oscillibacter sp.]
MKKALFNIFTAAVVFSMAVTMAFAAEPGRGRCFVDADGDGICDHYVSGQGCGSRCGGGFVDADGDGICDNYVSGQGWGHSGHGGHGFRGGRCR